jgi:hypothetical protein
MSTNRKILLISTIPSAFLFGILLSLNGCTLSRQPTPRDMAAMAESIVYFQDVHGICYASITSYAYGVNFVVSLTAVPCEKVGL